MTAIAGSQINDMAYFSVTDRLNMPSVPLNSTSAHFRAFQSPPFGVFGSEGDFSTFRAFPASVSVVPCMGNRQTFFNAFEFRRGC